MQQYCSVPTAELPAEIHSIHNEARISKYKIKHTVDDVMKNIY